jgi:hypothetical protein
MTQHVVLKVYLFSVLDKSVLVDQLRSVGSVTPQRSLLYVYFTLGQGDRYPLPCLWRWAGQVRSGQVRGVDILLLVEVVLQCGCCQTTMNIQIEDGLKGLCIIISRVGV